MEVFYYLIITKDGLIKEIANKEGFDVDIIRTIFQSAEEVVFNHLSSAPLSEEMIVKIANGLYIERKYVPPKKYSKGMFHDIECPAHVKVKPVISKYYDKKINDALLN